MSLNLSRITTKGLFVIDWGMFRPSLEGVLFLVSGLAKVDLRVEMCVLEVRSGWDLVQQYIFPLGKPAKKSFLGFRRLFKSW